MNIDTARELLGEHIEHDEKIADDHRVELLTALALLWSTVQIDWGADALRREAARFRELVKIGPVFGEVNKGTSKTLLSVADHLDGQADALAQEGVDARIWHVGKAGR